jgi:hypothetical protein
MPLSKVVRGDRKALEGEKTQRAMGKKFCKGLTRANTAKFYCCNLVRFSLKLILVKAKPNEASLYGPL